MRARNNANQMSLPFCLMCSASHCLWHDSCRFTDIVWEEINLKKTGAINFSSAKMQSFTTLCQTTGNFSNLLPVWRPCRGIPSN